MTSVRRVQLPEETSPRTSRIKKHGSHLLDRVPMDNEDAVNVVAFSLVDVDLGVSFGTPPLKNQFVKLFYGCFE